MDSHDQGQLEDLLSQLEDVDDALDELDELLAPSLFDEEYAANTDFTQLQKARFSTLQTYVGYDLIFMYLKAKGVDPMTHPVVNELRRVKEYYEKIKSVEAAPSRNFVVDEKAAGRFINHAIKTALAEKSESASQQQQSKTIVVPTKVTEKMRQRQEYEANLAAEKDRADESDEDEEPLQVFSEISKDAGRSSDTSPLSRKESKKRRRQDKPHKKRIRRAKEAE